jgi:hypothetical protein
MRVRNLKCLARLALLCVLVLGTHVATRAQYQNTSAKNRSNEKSTNSKEMKTSAAPTLSATLVDPEKKALEKTAAVEVKVTGIQLIDPAKVKEQPKAGHGHLH